MSVVGQADVVALLTVGSAQTPNENVLQIGDAGNKQLVALKEEGDKGLSAFFEKEKAAGRSVLGANGLPPLPPSRHPSSTGIRYEMMQEQSYQNKYVAELAAHLRHDTDEAAAIHAGTLSEADQEDYGSTMIA